MAAAPLQAVFAAGITVGSGGSFSIGTGSIDVGCGDVQVDGELSLNTGSLTRAASVLINGVVNGNSGLLQFGNDWAKNGTFNRDTSTVALVDECGDGTSSFSGDTAFWNLGINSTTGKVVTFEAGKLTAVFNDILFAGSPGNLLTLQSSSALERWLLVVDGAANQYVDWVAVSNSYALVFSDLFALITGGQHMAPGSPATFNSVDRGGNLRWFLQGLVPIPALSTWGMVLMIGAMLLIALGRRRQVF